MKTITIKKSVWSTTLSLVCLLGVVSCNENKFLNVTDPGTLSTATFPTKLSDMDLSLIDLYGRLRFGYYSDQFRYAGILPDHTADLGYNGSGFNEFAELRNVPGDGSLGYYWSVHNENIIRANNFIQNAARLRAGFTAADQASLDVMVGQARFIRALNYFILESLFGETMITSDADRARMGIPLWDGQVATSIADAARPRATVGAVWDYIIADLQQSATLLKGKVWDDANKPRVDEWAAKSLLGKALVFTRQYAAAAPVLKDVIDNSGHRLVPYANLFRMFNGADKYNAESLFEVNFTPDRRDVWNTQLNTSGQYGIFISPSYLEDDGVGEGTNGFGNLFIHDLNNDRYGFTDTTTSTARMRTPAYRQMSLAMRANKTVDPRMMVGMLQPWVDTIFVYDKWRPVTKNRGEGFPLAVNQAWNHRKYVLLDRGIWQGQSESLTNNFIVLRLADVYLLYAEAMANTGNTAQALEFVNKVHRRAYDVPVDTPSRFDYRTLTDRTTARGANDHLATDVLKYERWAELFAEGQWWFDVCRWKIGPQEVRYYVRVKSGALTWDDRKYAFPIPQQEILNNPQAKQNPGY